MSSWLFPYTLPGIQFNYRRKYDWGKTGYQRALSGVQATLRYQLYPLVNFEYSFAKPGYLRDGVYGAPDDLQSLVGMINAVAGRYDTFLHTDPDFNTITPAQAAVLGLFGTGDGSTLGPFQLTATYQNSGGPGAAEIIQNLNGTPILYDNGSTISAANYSVGATGIVTFLAGHAPAAGHLLTWSGGFYYRCRFGQDSYDFTKFMKGLWRVDKVDFTSVILS